MHDSESEVSGEQRAEACNVPWIIPQGSPSLPYSLQPALGDHLDGRIETGTFCVYRPDPARPIEWHLD